MHQERPKIGILALSDNADDLFFAREESLQKIYGGNEDSDLERCLKVGRKRATGTTAQSQEKQRSVAIMNSAGRLTIGCMSIPGAELKWSWITPRARAMAAPAIAVRRETERMVKARRPSDFLFIQKRSTSSTKHSNQQWVAQHPAGGSARHTQSVQSRKTAARVAKKTFIATFAGYGIF